MSALKCKDCSAPVAADQRFCIACGARTAPIGAPWGVIPAVAGAAAVSPGQVPASTKAGSKATGVPVQAISMYAVITLAFGVVVGTALNPGLAGLGALGPQVVQIMAGDSSAEESVDDSGSGAGAVAQEPAKIPIPAGYSSAPVSRGGGGGSGGGEDDQGSTTEQLSGVVAGVNLHADTFALAQGGSPLAAIHSSKLPEPGQEVELKARFLANGTYELKGKLEVVGSSVDVDLSGTVSYRDPAGGFYVVSARGTSTMVERSGQAGGALANDTRPLPKVGDLVEVSAKLEKAQPAARGRREGRALTASGEANSGGSSKPCDQTDPFPPAVKPGAPVWRLTEQNVTTTAEGLTSWAISGLVQYSCEENDRLSISADDVRASGADQVFSAPEAFDLTLAAPGDHFILFVDGRNLAQAGLLGMWDNTSVDKADDTSVLQGEEG